MLTRISTRLTTRWTCHISLVSSGTRKRTGHDWLCTRRSQAHHRSPPRRTRRASHEHQFGVLPCFVLSCLPCLIRSPWYSHSDWISLTFAWFLFQCDHLLSSCSERSVIDLNVYNQFLVSSSNLAYVLHNHCAPRYKKHPLWHHALSSWSRTTE